MNSKSLCLDGSPEALALPAVCRIFSRTVSAIFAAAMAVSALCVLVALAVIAYSVVVRYFLGEPSLWVDEVVGYLVVAIVMFGVASALREGRHIGVDLLTERLGPRGRRLAEAWSMLGVLALAVFLIANGWETAMFSKSIEMVSQGYLEVPLYALQLLIPFGGCLLALAAVDALLRLAFGGSAHVGQEKH
ncbi:TRAP-type C4-dicarboxylate transport system, small permease component [Azotobacter beijerinckii]|uniref:TRAP transporter small permease protein n=1 Tax=Azotobacter beijerinckii TaxID=170623 RepID=A0A1H9GI90_9GAMM|nr:TRAP transporter small permease [Azotobacter beijerinckii]SEQ49810.1 TRAP-type C4-dicarboxylate transport system, small permease component [Azotobacter beijerinckii]